MQPSRRSMCGAQPSACQRSSVRGSRRSREALLSCSAVQRPRPVASRAAGPSWPGRRVPIDDHGSGSRVRSPPPMFTLVPRRAPGQPGDRGTQGGHQGATTRLAADEGRRPQCHGPRQMRSQGHVSGASERRV